MLIKLIEEWKKDSDKNKLFEDVFMDISKAFECIPMIF